MLRRLLLVAVTSATLTVAQFAAAQDKTAAAPENNTVCTFQDGKQVSIRYESVTYTKKAEVPMGKVWTPANRPMYLFSQADLAVGNSTVAPGAYSFYVIPGKQQWTMIINRDVKDGDKYNSSDDLARIPADIGELSNAVPTLTLYFGSTGPKTCALRLDYGKTRAFADLTEK